MTEQPRGEFISQQVYVGTVIPANSVSYYDASNNGYPTFMQSSSALNSPYSGQISPRGNQQVFLGSDTSATMMPYSSDVPQANMIHQPVVVVAHAANDGTLQTPPDILTYELELMNAARIVRLVKVFAIIDFIFTLINAAISLIFFIMIIFPTCGYYGAKHLKYSLLLLYTIYTILSIILRAVLIALMPYYFLWHTIGILISFYCLRYCTATLQTIKGLPEDRKQEISSLANQQLC